MHDHSVNAYLLTRKKPDKNRIFDKIDLINNKNYVLANIKNYKKKTIK